MSNNLIDEKALTSVFILDNVLLPLLRQNDSAGTGTGTGTGGTLTKASNLRSSLHLTYAKKFVSRVCRFLEQEKKGIRLTIPPELHDALTKNNKHNHNHDDHHDHDGTSTQSSSVSRTCTSKTDANANANANTGINTIDIDAMATDTTLVELMEDALKKWSEIVAECIENELNQTHKNKGPMSEVDFWRRRHVVLSNVSEQIQQDNIQTILQVLKAVEYPTAHYHHTLDVFAMVTKLSIEAGDNARFLSTLERHLRTLTDGSLEGMIAALPALVDGMRMLWTVSRHYNRDERMLPLMERVAYQVALRCREFVQPHVLLQSTCDADLYRARGIIHQSKSLLQSWKDSYMVTREKIELMGTSQRRWEFDRVLLFEKTDYMASICDDLLNMLDAIHDFRQLFSAEVLEISGSNDGIDNVSRDIDSLVELIATRTCPIDQFNTIFDETQRDQWKELKITFGDIANEIEKRSATSLEHVFVQLRSSEKAYELIVKLKGIKTQPLIQKLIDDRNIDILERYEMELDQAIHVFHKNRDSPPLCTRYQKTCGLVSWADQLYLRTKRSIVLFKKFGTLMESPRGVKIKKKYLRFAKEIDKFKEEAFEEWCITSKDACDSGLRRPLLSSYSENTRHVSPKVHVSTSDDTSISSRYDRYRNDSKETTEGADEKHLPVMIATNFSKEVEDILVEAEQFDAIGYTIPENVLHLTLQKQIFERYVMELEKFVKLHNSTLRTMSEIELIMLKEQMHEMNQVIHKNLNWTSQSIPSFIATANNAIDTLRSTLDETRKQSKSIEFIVSKIAKASLVTNPVSVLGGPDDGTTTSATLPTTASSTGSSFDEVISAIIDERSTFLANEYKAIPSLMLKVEMATSQTNSGCLPLLKSYYNYWEKRAHNAAVEMCLRSILNLVLYWKEHFSTIKHDSSSNCSSDVSLSKAPIILERCISSILVSTDKFARWKNESCHEALYQNQDGDGSEMYSIRDDVCRDPSIVSLLWGIKEAIEGIDLSVD